MNTNKIKVLVFALGLLLGGALTRVWSASTDTIQLVVTPGVTYAVQITSADAGIAYNFGTVDLNVTTRSERPAVVQNVGNITSEWQISASGVDTWTLGDSTGTQNVAVLKALFEWNGGPVPSAAHFNTVNGSTLSATVKNAENQTNATDTAIVTNIAVSQQRDLYFMLHTPNTSSVGTAQNFRVYVTAVAP